MNRFYGGMSPAMRQLLETMCGGDFLSKHPEDAMEFLSYVAETSKGWDEPNPREIERFRPPVNQRGGMYALNDEREMRARLSTLARKVEELEGKQLHEVQAVTDNTAQPNPCTNFQSPPNPVEQCFHDPYSEGFDVRMCTHCRTIQAPTTKCSLWEYLQSQLEESP